MLRSPFPSARPEGNVLGCACESQRAPDPPPSSPGLVYCKLGISMGKKKNPKRLHAGWYLILEQNKSHGAVPCWVVWHGHHSGGDGEHVQLAPASFLGMAPAQFWGSGNATSLPAAHHHTALSTPAPGGLFYLPVLPVTGQTGRAAAWVAATPPDQTRY